MVHPLAEEFNLGQPWKTFVHQSWPLAALAAALAMLRLNTSHRSPLPASTIALAAAAIPRAIPHGCKAMINPSQSALQCPSGPELWFWVAGVPVLGRCQEWAAPWIPLAGVNSL